MRPGPNALQIGEWVADPADDSLTRGKDCTRLEPRAMQLLLRLARTPGQVVSQDTLLNDVWQGVIVSPASVYQTVSQLRKALGDTTTPPTYVETVSRKGYRLIAPVRPASSTDPEQPVHAPPVVPEEPPPLATPSPPPSPLSSPPVVRRPGFRWRRMAVAATFVMLAVIIGWLRHTHGASTGDSIVVLPILDLTPDKSDQPLCDGLTEELSNSLAQIPTLRVVARTSAFAFRDKSTDVREIGKQLGVTHVLEGSFRRSGNIARITLQLIKSDDGFHVWSDSYERPIGDILLLQETIAREVATRMEDELSLALQARISKRSTRNAQAMQAYLLARHHQEPRSKEGNDRAIALYREALAADPGFTLAKVGLANAYLDTNYYDDSPMEQVAALVRPLLDEVERADPKLGELYVVRGALRTNLYDRDAARADFEHALRLAPNSSAALAAYGRFLLIGGEPREALRRITDAVRLDPLSFRLHAQRCQALIDLAEFEAADSTCARARALQPSAPYPLSVSSDLEEARGHPAQALLFTELALRKSAAVAEIHADRCRWFMRLGLVDAARDAYQQALSQTPADAARGGNLLLTTLGLRIAYATGGKSALAEHLATHGLASSNDPELLFELADAWIVAGDARAARRYSDRALASGRLEPWELTSAWNARTGRSYPAIAAAAELATGDRDAGNRHLDQASGVVERLIAAGVRRHALFMLRADLAALRGDAEGAMQALREAAALGWRDARATENYPYFAAVRGRDDYRALIGEIRARNAADAASVVKLGPVR